MGSADPFRANWDGAKRDVWDVWINANWDLAPEHVVAGAHPTPAA
jgi:hypothetical protein